MAMFEVLSSSEEKKNMVEFVAVGSFVGLWHHKFLSGMGGKSMMISEDVPKQSLLLVGVQAKMLQIVMTG